MNVYSNILDMVGQTPMLEVTRIDTGPCRLFLKLELMNPGGSIKDRIGISMIEEAEKLAGKQERSIMDRAGEQMKSMQMQELQRLKALAEINPNIRKEEIEYLATETGDLQHYLQSSHIRLDALRVAVINE